MDTRILHASAKIAQPWTGGAGHTSAGTTGAADLSSCETVQWSMGPRLPGAGRSVKSPFAANPPLVEGPAAPVAGAPIAPASALAGVVAPADPASAIPEPQRSFSHRLLGAVALGLAGLGIIGGAVAVPQPAMAQGTVAPPVQGQTQRAVQTDNRVRDTRPVQTHDISQAVSQFSRDRQLYVVGYPALNGAPLSRADLARYQEVLQKHPNVYVVLVDRTSNVAQDDLELSRGIGNSEAFQSVVNPQTGERDGVVFMIYHNVNGDAQARKIFMRSEAMLDQLGVGDEAFEPATGGRLFDQFVHAFRDEGKDIPGALEVVLKTQQGAVDAHVHQVVGGATQSVQQARTALDGVGPRIQEFQRRYGQGGKVGSPDIQGWSRQLDRASEALTRRDFATASTLSNNVLSAVRSQEALMAAYGQAPATAAQVREQLDSVKSQLATLENNGHAQVARQAFEAARQGLQQYETQYRAKDPAFQQTLESARTEAATAVREARASKSASETADTAKKAAAAAVTLAILATAVISNRRAHAVGEKARRELDEAIKEIGARSNELMELLNTADVHEVAHYEGKTKELADSLRANVVEALTLVGGAQKFLAEADRLVNAKGAGALKNWFTTSQYRDAIALLTDPERKLGFSFNDSSRAVMEKGSKAESWREQLLEQGASREFQKSLREVLLAMADSRDHARQMLSEIETKSADITTYLDRVNSAAARAQQEAKALQAQAGDGLFAAPAVTENLLPMVLAGGQEGGLLAKGRDLSARNFVAAWDDCAAPAERMSSDAGRIVDLGVKARQELVPTVAQADASLNPQGVKTDWAHAAQEALSDRLDTIANKALRTAVSADVEALGVDVAKLQIRVTTAVAQDSERREVSPGLIKDAEKDVDVARAEIAATLKGMGAFAKGTPEQVMREADLDPTTRTVDAHAQLDAVKGRLDEGDVDQAAEHLAAVRSLSTDAHRLVAETRAALKAHASTLGERSKRTGDIETSIPVTYQPSLARIKEAYAPEVMCKVASEVAAGDTLADNIDQSLRLIESARKQTESARANFDRAFLLTSRDDLGRADRSLLDAQAQLDGITRAEKILADRQHAVESGLGQLDGRYAQTRSRSGEHYVRSHARDLMRQGEGNLQSARTAVQAKAKDPYRADEAIQVAENVRGQVETAIAADKRAFDAATRAIHDAEGNVVSATAAVASAQGQSWHWSNSQGSASESVSALDLAGAYSAIQGARASVDQAKSQLRSQDYEAAASTASSASSHASTASMAAASAVSSARSRFESQKRHLESLEEAERRRQEEERRRQEEAARSSYSSGSSGGGFSGSGGSGSHGGSF